MPHCPATSIEEEEEGGLSLPSHFPFDYKSVARLFPQSPLTCLLVPLTVSFIYTSTSHVSLCLSLNSFCAET